LERGGKARRLGREGVLCTNTNVSLLLDCWNDTRQDQPFHLPSD